MVRYLTQFDESALGYPPARPASGDLAELAAWERAMRQRIRAWGSLFANLSQAEQLTWVLKQDDTPIYAIYPNGPFAVQVYSRLVEILEDQESHVSEMVSLPGRTVGKARLVNGQEVPLVVPDLRGLYNWSVDSLIKAVLPAGTVNELSAAEAEVRNFLQRIYFEVRNLGLMPQERALNFAATNVFQFKSAYAQAVRESVLNPTLRLDRVDVERSPLCRPGSDCWDVKLTFFEPAKRLESARQVHDRREPVDPGDGRTRAVVVRELVSSVRNLLSQEHSHETPSASGTCRANPSRGIGRAVKQSGRCIATSDLHLQDCGYDFGFDKP
jgi:hypothetical protein